VGDIHQLKITEGEMYQDTESKLEKCTHFLERANNELLGHRKTGNSKGHSLSREVRSGLVRTGNFERKQASNRYLLPGEGKGQDWSLAGHGKKTS